MTKSSSINFLAATHKHLKITWYTQLIIIIHFISFKFKGIFLQQENSQIRSIFKTCIKIGIFENQWLLNSIFNKVCLIRRSFYFPLFSGHYVPDLYTNCITHLAASASASPRAPAQEAASRRKGESQKREAMPQALKPLLSCSLPLSTLIYP